MLRSDVSEWYDGAENEGMMTRVGHRPEAQARGYKFLLALTTALFLLGPSSQASALARIHLPGKVARDAEVGLAVSAPNTVYAAYWVEGEHARPWEMRIYKFNALTGRVIAQFELDKAQPLRTSDGYVIQSSVDLYISPDGDMLLCTSLERTGVKAWTLASRDLRILSERTFPLLDANLLGFTHTGDVRLLNTHMGGTFGE